MFTSVSRSSSAPRLAHAHILVSCSALFGRGLRQTALIRGAADDPALAEALERIRAWESATLKAAKAAGRTPPKALDEADDGDSAAALPLPRYARINTLRAFMGFIAGGPSRGVTQHISSIMDATVATDNLPFPSFATHGLPFPNLDEATAAGRIHDIADELLASDEEE